MAAAPPKGAASKGKIQMKLNFRQRLLATTLFVGASALATPAFAQDAPDPSLDPAQAPPTGEVSGQPIPQRSAEGEQVQQPSDIIVTGSRIPQPNLESAAPVTVVSNQDVKLSGTTRVEDLLNSLPSVGASQTSGIANGATGTAEVDLRYLGSKRTLSLINGRRIAPGDPNSTSQAADINIIPASLVRRVEVLTGGASSVYGADAVAGVVNFIMDTDFTGVRIDGQVGAFQHNNDDVSLGTGGTNASVRSALNARINAGLLGYDYPTGNVVDGTQFDATVSLGAAFDDGRGHAMAYVGYRRVRPILQSRRDYSACGLSGAGANIICSGSGTSAEGNFFTSVFDIYTFGPEGTVVPGQSVYNFNPSNYFQRPDDRYVGGAFANYEISDLIEPYVEFMFMDDRTKAQIAPSGNFGNTLTLNCDNPLMSEQARDVICAPGNLVNGFLGTYPLTQDALGEPTGAPQIFFGPDGTQYTQGFAQVLRRNVEGGPRISDLRHTNFRGVLGTRGDISPAFSYDTYLQYGRTNYTQVYQNEFSISRLVQALDVVDDPRTPGVVDPICRSVLAGNINCVPYNLFGEPTDASINYLNIFGVIQGHTSETVANFNVTGSLADYGIATPWAPTGAGINVGVEYRREALELNPDQSFQQGDLAGQGAPTLPVNGGFRVLEAFGEVQFPLVTRSFIEDLTLGAGYRKSFYRLSNGREFDTDTYKLSLEFAPVRDLRFRGSYNRAVRAPNVQELFATQFVGLSGSEDPCAGITITATDYGCLAQGLTVGQMTPANPAEQYNGLLGGNPNLNPEKASTKTLGVVIQPGFLPRFSFTADYFNIEVEDAIQGFGTDAVVGDCVANATATFTPASCALINRDPGGSIWLTSGGFIVDTPTNVGGLKTTGFDFNSSYRQPVGSLGTVSASFVGTRLLKYITNNGISEPYDCVGFYGGTCSGGSVSSSAPIPKWRHKLRTTLEMPNGIGLSLQWRHIGRVEHEALSDDETLSGSPPVLGRVIKGQNYFDLASTFTVGDNYNLRMGVNNLFDRTPPLITSSAGSCPAGPCSGNTYPGTWDYLGRFFYVGATLDF